MKIPAGKKANFAWDEMIGPKLLEIEIESIHAEYNLDTIKDYDPIILNQGPGVVVNKNEKYVLKKGYLGRKKPYDEEYEEE